MFLLGLVLILGLIMWRINLVYEWSIPLKWQNCIKSWQEKLSSKTYNLKYVWYMGQGHCDLEKHLYHLQMALPKLQKKFSVPLGIEVFVYQGLTFGQKEKYISCLQRRFPDIEIQVYSSCESNVNHMEWE